MAPTSSRTMFTDAHGAHLVPDEVTRASRKLMRRAASRAAAADPRHLHATHMLAAGVPVNSSASLGHTRSR
jgi:hypothetical protein